MIDIEQYSLVKLPEVSKILSSVGFIRECMKGSNHNKTVIIIHSPEVYDPKKMEFVIEESEGFAKGYAILPNIKMVNIVYLTSILNAYVSWAFIADGSMEKRTSVTIEKLSNIAIRVLPDYLQKGVAYLHYLLMEFKKHKKEEGGNPYLDYWISVYKEIQNAIALELVMPQMFKKYEIDMLDAWCGLIDKCTKDYPNITLEQLKNALGNELLTPQNVVIGNMKKLRVVMRTITEHMTETV